MQRLLELRVHARVSWLKWAEPLRRISQWEMILDVSERQLRRWPFVMTLLLVLAMAVFVLALGL